MNNKQWLGFLLPVGLALTGIVFLIRVSDISSSTFLPANLDLIIILLGLSLMSFASIALILRELLERLRDQTIEQARNDAFAEHRRFLRRLDHELKNPLTAFHAGLGSLRITLQGEDHRRLLETMEVEARRLSQLVTDLRKLAELDTVPLETYAINIANFFHEIIELEADHIEAQGRTFTVQLPDDVHTLPSLVGDQDLLLLAIHNLLDNAVKYTHPGDTITLTFKPVDDDLEIQVVDTGIGIDEDDLPLVWEELYRGSQSEGIPGNGIGLALVRAIVERHFGTVSLQSQVEVGTTVSIRLPLI